MKRFLWLLVVLGVILSAFIGCSTKGKITYHAYKTERVGKKYFVKVKIDWFGLEDERFYYYTDTPAEIKGDTLIIRDAFCYGLKIPEIRIVCDKDYVSYTITTDPTASDNK